MARPLVLVFQEIAQPQGTPATPDLHTVIIGPAYDIKDYPDDAAETLLSDTYGALEQPAGGTDQYTPPGTGEDALTVTAYPGQSPGSVVDHASVRLVLALPRVVLGSTVGLGPSLGTHVTTTSADRTLIAFPTGDLQAKGVRPGDRIMLTSSNGTQSIERTISSVAEPNASGLGTDETLCRVTQALPDEESYATGSITVVGGGSLVDGETFTLDDGVNPATVFEFDSGGGVSGANVAIAFTGGDSAGTVRDAVIAAINGVVGGLLITASIGGAAVVTLTADRSGTQSNQTVTETVANVGFIVSGMSGGTRATTEWAYDATGEARIERTLSTQELIDPDHTYITFPVPGSDEMVMKGGISLNLTLSPVPTVAVPVPTTSTVSRLLSYAQVYIAYRALRQDVNEPISISNTDVVARSGVTTITGLGRVDARNPLAAALFVALQNSGNTPVWALGVSSDDIAGHTEARGSIASRRELYCLVPLTQDTNILASYKFEVDSLADPTTAVRDGVPQIFRIVLGSSTLPIATIISEGTISGVSQQPGTSTGHYRTLSFLVASHVDLTAVLPGDTVILGVPSTGAPAGWQARRGTHRVAHVNQSYQSGSPSNLELEPGSSRWLSTAGTSAGDIELLIKAPDGTQKVAKLGNATMTQNGGTIVWTMKAPTQIGGPYTVQYISGSVASIALVGFAIRVTYVSGVTTHAAVKVLADAHPVISGLVTTEVTVAGTTITGAVGATPLEVQSGACTASVVVNDNLYDRFEDATALFLSGNVKVGDLLEIPVDANDYTAGAFAGRYTSYVIAQVLSETRVLIQNGRDDSPGSANELPHGYMREYQNRTVDNTTPNAIRYRIRRALTKDDQVLTLTSLSQSFRSKRVTLLWPDEVKVTGLVDGSLARAISTVPVAAGWVPGYYGAAVIGGALAGLPVQHGLTNLGFAGISDVRHANGYFSEPQLSRLSDGGWFILYKKRPQDLPICLHQLTTDTSAVQTGELSVVRNLDFVSIFLQDIVNEFLGQYNVLPETTNEMQRAVAGGMEDLKSRRIAHFGAPLLNGSVTLIKVSDVHKDKYELWTNVEIPGPVNGVDLHIVS